jgi:dipeptidyl aminopeptidase/acylaminoacyl peptidase
LSARDIASVRWLSGVSVRPDGGEVCVVETRLDQDADTTVSGLLVVDAADGSVRTSPAALVNPAHPRWSPDGRMLALVAEHQGAAQLWLWTPCDGAVRRLTDEPDGVAGPPDWSPDGARLVFTAPLPPDGPGPADAIARPAYLVGDGAHAAGAAPGRPPARAVLRVCEVATGASRDLTDRHGFDQLPRWSPDGRRVAFVSDRGGDGTHALWSLEAAGGPPTRHVGGRGLVDAPVWSPDGAEIAYIGNDDAADHAVNRELRVVRLRDGATRSLTTALDVSVGVCVQSDDPRGYGDARLCWPAGGRGILCSFPVGGAVRLAWVPAERPPAATAELTTVVDGDRVVVSFAASATGDTVAFVSTDPSTPGEVRIAAPGGERQLTARNADWLAGVELGPVALTRVRSSDGTPLDAWLLTPPASLGSTPAPLLLFVHGGPHWPAGWRFSFDHQRLAARGVAVCVANPRGSQGYGQAFSTAIRGDWGRQDLADVLAVAEHAASRPEIDAGRLAIAGASYGGYLCCLALAQTSRFRAAIAENPVTDLVSYFGTTADGGAFAVAEFGGTPWQAPDFYRDRAPINQVATMRAPLLLVHGELDADAPIGQSEQLHASLRWLGRDVRLLRVPGEGHGMVLDGTPAHRRQRWAAIDAFLDRHLGTNPEGTSDDAGLPDRRR